MEPLVSRLGQEKKLRFDVDLFDLLIVFFFVSLIVGQTRIAKEMIISGQIIATSHDLTPKGSQGREIPLFQRNLGW